MQLFHQLLSFLNASALIHKSLILCAVPCVSRSQQAPCPLQCQAASPHRPMQNIASAWREFIDLHTHTHWHTQGNTILSSKTHKISMMGGKSALQESSPIQKEHRGGSPSTKLTLDISVHFNIASFKKPNFLQGSRVPGAQFQSLFNLGSTS